MKKILLVLSLIIIASGFVGQNENHANNTAIKNTNSTVTPLVNKIGPDA